MTAAERPTVPTAIILGGDVNGLGVARSLARHGIPLLLLDTNLSRPTMRTRYGRKLALPSLSGNLLIESLRTLRRQFEEAPVLIPTQEASLAALSSAYSEVKINYRLALPSENTIKLLLDKTLFQTKAEELGFLVPRSLTLSRNTEKQALGQLRFPCVLKPATKEDSYAQNFAKAYRVSNSEEAMTLWSKMQGVISTAIIQEWIEGRDSDVYFCLQYRRPAGGIPVSFCGRKTLQWPPLVGGTATCIPAPEADSVLTSLTSKFFDLLGFVGLCSMEYKRDARDGKFYMVEPTVGRTDYQEEIAVLNGVNIPLAAYCDLAGVSRGTIYEKTPVRGWRDPFGHHRALASGARDPIFELVPNISLVDAYFRFYDPMPYLATRSEHFAKRFQLTRSSK